MIGNKFDTPSDIFLFRLRKELTKRELTIKEFSEGIGVHENTIYNWLYGDNVIPRAATLVDIALYFGVAIDYLLGMDYWEKKKNGLSCE